jgi:hypothetical protein
MQQKVVTSKITVNQLKFQETVFWDLAPWGRNRMNSIPPFIKRKFPSWRIGRFI